MARIESRNIDRNACTAAFILAENDPPFAGTVPECFVCESSRAEKRQPDFLIKQTNEAEPYRFLRRISQPFAEKPAGILNPFFVGAHSHSEL
jgi:hypothetical protein